jgi:lysophospholipase L1-like esterase
MEAVLQRNSVGTVPRGRPSGIVAAPGEELSVLLMGDSTIGGKDIPDHTRTLGCRLAQTLSARTGRAVRWAVLARPSATPREITEKLAAKVARFEPDLIVIGLGGNGLPLGYSPDEWGSACAEMIDELRARAGVVPVVIAATPSAHLLKAIPQPLRAFWGLRNRLYDTETKRHVRSKPAVTFGPPYAARKKEHLGPDGCHPSAEGYAIWAKLLADTIVPLLSHHQDTVSARQEAVILPAHKSA